MHHLLEAGTSGGQFASGLHGCEHLHQRSGPFTCAKAVLDVIATVVVIAILVVLAVFVFVLVALVLVLVIIVVLLIIISRSHARKHGLRRHPLVPPSTLHDRRVLKQRTAGMPAEVRVGCVHLERRWRAVRRQSRRKCRVGRTKGEAVEAVARLQSEPAQVGRVQRERLERVGPMQVDLDELIRRKVQLAHPELVRVKSLERRRVLEHRVDDLVAVSEEVDRDTLEIRQLDRQVALVGHDLHAQALH